MSLERCDPRHEEAASPREEGSLARRVLHRLDSSRHFRPVVLIDKLKRAAVSIQRAAARLENGGGARRAGGVPRRCGLMFRHAQQRKEGESVHIASETAATRARW